MRHIFMRGAVLALLIATLTACAKTTWQDFSGNNRGAPEMQMDSANCQLYAQANTQQTDTSQCQQGKGQTGCILAGVISNALAQGMTFNTCMQGRGWQQVQVQVASVVQSPPICSGQACAPKLYASLSDDEENDAADNDDGDTDDVMADAQDAWQSEDYSNALDLYRQAASDGNPGAENKVGLFYANGWGVKQDPKEAGRWFRKADRDGSPYAKRNLIRLSQRLQDGQLQPVHLSKVNQHPRGGHEQVTN